MDTNILKLTVAELMSDGKGLLALDESIASATKRLASIGVDSTEENRRLFRELFIGTLGVEKYVTGMILFDETVWQADSRGVPFPKVLERHGVLTGVKVDTGLVPFAGFPGESVTEGLDGLRERLVTYRKAGARFLKWRAAFTIDEGQALPTDVCIRTNATILARYARIAQEEGLVPIVEPEVVRAGTHTIATAQAVTQRVLYALFQEVATQRVYLPGLILKTSMAIAGDASTQAKEGWQKVVPDVAHATCAMLLATVPDEVGGVVFLSGGQEPAEATANLDAIAEREPLPWPIAFSYARAIQEPVLELWKGDEHNVSVAREEFIRRLELNAQADQGTYDVTMEQH